MLRLSPFRYKWGVHNTTPPLLSLFLSSFWRNDSSANISQLPWKLTQNDPLLLVFSSLLGKLLKIDAREPNLTTCQKFVDSDRVLYRCRCRDGTEYDGWHSNILYSNMHSCCQGWLGLIKENKGQRGLCLLCQVKGLLELQLLITWLQTWPKSF